MRRVLLLLALLAGLAAAGPAGAARFAVGLAPGTDADALAAALVEETGGSVTHDLVDLGALTLTARSARGVRGLAGVAYVERLDRSRRLAAPPAEPLIARQWYLQSIRAFEWAAQAPLAGPLVAIVDSGVDGEHPELKPAILEARSFVGGKATVDEQGHGTFVAGVVAAAHDGRGIAGIAPEADLLIAKVVGPDRTISLEAEVKAIRWAADRGARVINLSLGGIRSPGNADEDTYSPLEAAAVSYAYAKGAVLVAAVGNADQAPAEPWPWANYPAALPHVLGVSALARDGSVPSFSHRDRIFNDIAAPGTEMYSTFPLALTAQRAACANQGYSDCGTEEYRPAEGTSFAAPQVAGAAALLLGVRPDLRADQVIALLTRSAADVNAATGCRACPLRRDKLTGWGALDVSAAVAQALSGKLPAPDAREPNDDAGPAAAGLWGQRQKVAATVDYWDDQTDVYRVRLFSGQRLFVALKGPAGAKVFLWRPGTRAVDSIVVKPASRVAQSRRLGAVQRFGYRVPARRGGYYFLQVKMEAPGSGRYSLSFAKSKRR